MEPAIGEASDMLARNQSQSSLWDLPFPCSSLQKVRRGAREELIRSAVHYSQSYRNIREPKVEAPIVMAGHQPSLFHPGVWFKNFALAAVASSAPNGALSQQRTAINLVIDNDVATSAAIRVPIIDWKTGLVRQESIPFDEASGGVPYEQNHIRDRAIFDSFDRRLEQAIGPLVSRPLVGQLWKYASLAANRCENVSCAMAQARHALEADCGLQTLEVPLSVVCRGESFAQFALSILGDLPRFRDIYNQTLKQYRREHRIRSKAHPVPELQAEGDWVEAPFWIYGDESPQRRSLWVRKANQLIELSDRKSRTVRLTSPIGSPSLAAELASHNGPQWKLRPRALTTTMYARLILSDLFIHGIGGAKYDQLGDRIMQCFYGIVPPELMVVSATLQLRPVDRREHAARIADLKQQIRATRFAPEQIASAHLPTSLIERRRELLQSIPEKGHRKSWHEELTSINRSLESHLATIRADLESQLVSAKQGAASAVVLGSREYSFCLFDLQYLQESFGRMLENGVP
jgi:hypothetical protein